MSKNAKLLLGLTLIALLIVLYFIFSTRSITLEETGKKPLADQADLPAAALPLVDLITLEKEYKEETRIIVNEFAEIAGIEANGEESSQTGLGMDVATSTAAGNIGSRILELRGQLMNITVPSEFKELHLSLVFAFDRMEDYFISQAKSDRESSVELITKAKDENDWLN